MKRPDNINDAQWQAVISPSAYLLISAGPGTGKTHTLAYRICHILSKCQKGERVLAITFTNKASQEMQKRLENFSAGNPRLVDVSTFHAFCLSCLREFVLLTKLPQGFEVASVSDTQDLAKEIWSDIPSKEYKERLEAIARYKNLLDQDPPFYFDHYQQALRKKGLLDFDDILWGALYLFRHEKSVLKTLQARYRAVCVDEYQDINRVQHEILKVLVQGRVELTAIGDPRQAIYGFRGSDVRFFHDFQKDFPSGQHLSLSENYRSSGNLLEAAHQVIVKGPSLAMPSLIAHMHAQGRLVIYKAASERAEAEFVVHTIEKLLGGTSMFSKDSKRVSADGEGQVSFGDIAVLYRVNAQRKAIEEALERSGIPYHVSGAVPLCEEEDVAALLPKLRLMRLEPISTTIDHLTGLQGKKSNSLERLLDLAGQCKSTEDLLDHLFLARENETFAHRVEKVSLLTLHAAKGLEFPVVFMAGCEEGLLPLIRRGEETDVEEERRLFYVGMTRAKNVLYMSWAAKRAMHGKIFSPSVSRFVLDIEEKLKEQQESLLKERKKQRDQQPDLFKNL